MSILLLRLSVMEEVTQWKDPSKDKIDNSESHSVQEWKDVTLTFFLRLVWIGQKGAQPKVDSHVPKQWYKKSHSAFLLIPLPWAESQGETNSMDELPYLQHCHIQF